MAFDSELSKGTTFRDLLALLSSSGHSVLVVCGCRASLDDAVRACLVSSLNTVALIDGFEERELIHNIAAAKSQQSSLLLTDATLDSLSQESSSSIAGHFPFLINYDIPRDLTLDDRRTSLFGAGRKRGVIIDLFSSSETDQFKAIESSNTGEIPPLPMSLEDIL